MAAAMRVESLSALLTQTGPAAQCASTMTPTRATACTPKTARTIDPQPHWLCPWAVVEIGAGSWRLAKWAFSISQDFRFSRRQGICIHARSCASRCRKLTCLVSLANRR